MQLTIPQIENMLNNLHGALEKMFHWLSTNHLAANAAQFHPLTSFKSPVNTHISNSKILDEETVKLLGVNLEGKHNFYFHVNTLLRKQVKCTTICIARVSNYINKTKQRILKKAFIS